MTGHGVSDEFKAQAVQFMIDNGDALTRLEDNAYWEMDRQIHKEKVAACPALTSDRQAHDWELVLHDAEDSPLDHPWPINTSLECAQCPASMSDLWIDAEMFMFIELDNGIVVDAGRHASPVALVVSVDVRIESWRHSTPNGEEFDAEVIINQRGPVREEYR